MTRYVMMITLSLAVETYKIAVLSFKVERGGWRYKQTKNSRFADREETTTWRNGTANLIVVVVGLAS